MAHESTRSTTPTCRIIRTAETYVGKQGPTYAGGVSAESAGSQAIWMGVITLAPGSRTKAHYHAEHETALYLLSGEVDVWFGDELQEHDIMRAGDYMYIPAGVSHVAANRSQTDPAVVVGARTDPNEQESVVLQPELESKVPL
ncbi:MAG TPA: cupin domain-containing protein [Thermomicrobiales bacterium]|nr:cupin domain-containing protein [Thermomicrobiales bacterium]